LFFSSGFLLHLFDEVFSCCLLDAIIIHVIRDTLDSIHEVILDVGAKVSFIECFLKFYLVLLLILVELFNELHPSQIDDLVESSLFWGDSLSYRVVPDQGVA